ncbi:MAG: hypothetical protein OHK0039_00020 [Bacteroidia bacterium]
MLRKLSPDLPRYLALRMGWEAMAPFCWMGLLLLAAWQGLPDYLTGGLQSWLGILLLPFVWRSEDVPRFRGRYLLVALALLALYLLLKPRILFFLALGAALFYVWEQYRGRLRPLVWVWLLLLSPLPELVAEVFSFPLRLWMSARAGEVLSGMGMDIAVVGNSFAVNGSMFSIAPACLGLNTFVAGLMLTTGLLALQRSALPLAATAGVYLFAAASLVAGNFVRIMLLVLLASPPGTLGHELIGLSSLLLYTGLPVWWLLRQVSARWGRPERTTAEVAPGRGVWAGVLLLALSLWGTATVAMSRRTVPADWWTGLALPGGMEQVQLEDQVLCLYDSDLLIYLKPPVAPWRGDHHPQMCWRGAGFELQALRVDTVAGRAVYRGTLQRGAEVFETVWWYENGRGSTIGVWDWRMRVLRGEPWFHLVNITARDRVAVDAAVACWPGADGQDVAKSDETSLAR